MHKNAGNFAGEMHTGKNALQADSMLAASGIILLRFFFDFLVCGACCIECD